MSEIELKFGVPEPAVAAIERRCAGAAGVPDAIESHYWDSADRRLAEAGVSLRLRKSAGRWEQTVKAAGPNPAERLEETVARPGRWGAEGPAPDLRCTPARRPSRSSPRAARREGVEPPQLVPVFRSVIKRLAVEIEVGGALVEVAFDRGAIHAGDRSLPVCEVEAELKRGDASALVDVARAGIDAHGLWLSTASKAARGDRLADPADAPRATKAQPAQLRDGASGDAIFRAVIRSCLDQVLANASVIADGELDDDVDPSAARRHPAHANGMARARPVARRAGADLGSSRRRALSRARRLSRSPDRRRVDAASSSPLRDRRSPVLRRPERAPASDPVALVRAAPFQHALLDVVAFLLVPARLPVRPATNTPAMSMRRARRPTTSSARISASCTRA